MLQTELRESYPQLPISLLGVNEEGHEYGAAVVAEQGDIPWLQDVDADNNDVSDVWYDLWQITFRDVLILDGDNVPVATFNLSTSDLGEPESYAALRSLLLDAAMDYQKPYQNPVDPMDVDDNGLVIPLDVLTIVNEINSNGNYSFAPLQGTASPALFYDCNGDGDLTPLDALLVVNFLNEQSLAGEGEAVPEIRPPEPGGTPIGAAAAVREAIRPTDAFAGFDGRARTLSGEGFVLSGATRGRGLVRAADQAEAAAPAARDHLAQVDRVFAGMAAAAARGCGEGDTGFWEDSGVRVLLAVQP